MRAGTQRDRLTGRAHAQAEVAPVRELAVHQDVDAVVRTDIQIDGLRAREEPEAAPLHAEESPGQRGVLV